MPPSVIAWIVDEFALRVFASHLETETGVEIRFL